MKIGENPVIYKYKTKQRNGLSKMCRNRLSFLTTLSNLTLSNLTKL
jgi:hypothetical protein